MIQSLRTRIVQMKRSAMKQLPSSLRTSKPVVQVFINEALRKSSYTFINFPSLLSPMTAAKCHYKLVIYNELGKRVQRFTIPLDKFGSKAVRIDQLTSHPLPELGMISAQYCPDSRLNFSDRHLERLKPHFFSLYHDDDMGSCGLIHPQTLINQKPRPEFHWQSNHLIDTSPLRSVEVYQINPSQESVTSEVSLNSIDADVLVSKTDVLKPHGSRRLKWEIDSSFPEFICIAMKGVPAPNAKPLIFVNFKDGTYGAAHG